MADDVYALTVLRNHSEFVKKYRLPIRLYGSAVDNVNITVIRVGRYITELSTLWGSVDCYVVIL